MTRRFVDCSQGARTIAVIGWSDKEDRSSHGIADYLHARGTTWRW